MEPTNNRFGGGAIETILHPLVLVALLVAITLMFLLPRKYVLVPFLLTVFLVPFGQVVVLGGIHFSVYRILVIFGLARLAATRFPSATSRLAGGSNSIDRVLTLWALFALVIFSLQWMEMQAFIKSLGSLLDAVGAYFVLRFLIQDREDVRRVIKVFAIIAMVLAICMTNEQLTHENIFGLLGGMPLGVVIREGKARSTGSFEVYITAGVFGATLLPLFIWLWTDAKSKISASLGMLGATAMTLTSNSSTPQLAYVAGIVGCCLWPLRKGMRALRWGLGLTLVGLHLVMKAPVWALIARIDLTGSSSGYHRYMLVDMFIRHFNDWWLLGVKDYNTWGQDMWDLGNQFVACGFTGGLVTLILFIATISLSFGKLGTARKCSEGDREYEWLLWLLGVSLFAHVVAQFGIGYFDQLQMAWYALLAMITAATSVLAKQTTSESQSWLALDPSQEALPSRSAEEGHCETFSTV